MYARKSATRPGATQVQIVTKQGRKIVDVEHIGSAHTDVDEAWVVSALTVFHAYHQLFNVEASFRIAKTDLKARPIYHWAREKVEAHLMVVFAAITVSRWVQECTGASIKRFVRLLAPA